jgi:hypothetical protein
MNSITGPDTGGHITHTHHASHGIFLEAHTEDESMTGGKTVANRIKKSDTYAWYINYYSNLNYNDEPALASYPGEYDPPQWAMDISLTAEELKFLVYKGWVRKLLTNRCLFYVYPVKIQTNNYNFTKKIRLDPAYRTWTDLKWYTNIHPDEIRAILQETNHTKPEKFINAMKYMNSLYSGSCDEYALEPTRDPDGKFLFYVRRLSDDKIVDELEIKLYDPAQVKDRNLQFCEHVLKGEECEGTGPSSERSAKRGRKKCPDAHKANEIVAKVFNYGCSCESFQDFKNLTTTEIKKRLAEGTLVFCDKIHPGYETQRAFIDRMILVGRYPAFFDNPRQSGPVSRPVIESQSDRQSAIESQSVTPTQSAATESQSQFNEKLKLENQQGQPVFGQIRSRGTRGGVRHRKDGREEVPTQTNPIPESPGQSEKSDDKKPPVGLENPENRKLYNTQRRLGRDRRENIGEQLSNKAPFYI